MRRRVGSIVGAIASALPVLATAAAGTLLLGGCASCQSTVRIASMPVIAAGAFDGVETDQSAHRLYLADRTNQGVDVVDTSGSAPRFVKTVALVGSPSGLALASDRKRLYAALGDGSVAVVDVDPASARYLTRVDTLTTDTSSADLVDYGAKPHTLFVGADSQVALIDVDTKKVTKRISTVAPVEQPRYDPADGLLYATTPETDSLVQMDPATGLVTRTYVIPKCRPAGLGINPSRQLAMIACGSSIAMVNLTSGAQEMTRVVQGGDIVTYEAAADRFIVASPHGPTDSFVGVFSGDGSFVASVTSSPTAHAAAFDSAHGLVYAPGPKGLMSFAPAVCAPPPAWLGFAGGLSLFAAPMVAFGLFLVLYARRLRHPRAEPARPSFRDLQAEDLETERKRMRMLEDGILGPEA